MGVRPLDRSTDGPPSMAESCHWQWQGLAWMPSAEGLKGLGGSPGQPHACESPYPHSLAQPTAGLLSPDLYSSSKLRLGCPSKPSPPLAP